MKRNDNGKNLYDIVTTGYGEKEGQYEAFVKSYRQEDCNYIDEFNASLLQNAISHRKYTIAKYLIDHGCNLEHQDKEGFTALHYILSSRRDEELALAERLIEKMNNIDLEDKYGNTPLWYAVKNPKVPPKLIEKLLENGADPYHKNNVGKTPLDVVKRLNIPELNKIFAPYL